MQKNLYIEKIIFKVVQMKFLAMHITNHKLCFDMCMVGNVQNIFMGHDLYLMVFGIKETLLVLIQCIVGYCYKYSCAFVLRVTFVFQKHQKSSVQLNLKPNDILASAFLKCLIGIIGVYFSLLPQVKNKTTIRNDKLRKTKNTHVYVNIKIISSIQFYFFSQQ